MKVNGFSPILISYEPYPLPLLPNLMKAQIRSFPAQKSLRSYLITDCDLQISSDFFQFCPSICPIFLHEGRNYILIEGENLLNLKEAKEMSGIVLNQQEIFIFFRDFVETMLSISSFCKIGLHISEYTFQVTQEGFQHIYHPQYNQPLEIVQTGDIHWRNFYLSPEELKVLGENKPLKFNTEKSNIFSFAAMILNLMSPLDRRLIYSQQQFDIDQLVVNSKLQESKKHYSLSLVELISRCLRVDSEQRMNIIQLKQYIENGESYMNKELFEWKLNSLLLQQQPQPEQSQQQQLQLIEQYIRQPWQKNQKQYQEQEETEQPHFQIRQPIRKKLFETQQKQDFYQVMDHAICSKYPHQYQHKLQESQVMQISFDRGTFGSLDYKEQYQDKFPQHAVENAILGNIQRCEIIQLDDVRDSDTGHTTTLQKEKQQYIKEEENHCVSYQNGEEIASQRLHQQTSALIAMAQSEFLTSIGSLFFEAEECLKLDRLIAFFKQTGTWTQASLYFGGTQQCKRQGLGLNIFPNGEYYFGFFKEDIFEGEGFYYWKGGEYFHGFFKEGKQERGTYVKAHSWYQGEIKDRKRQGFGTFADEEGVSYKGYWQKGKREGLGIQLWGDCSFYGKWRDGQKHGKGILMKPSGNVMINWWQGQLSNCSDLRQGLPGSPRII